MRTVRFGRTGLVAALALAAGVVLGRGAEEPIRVLVNGKEVQGTVPWRLEEGRVVGPIAPVARALGAERVRWDKHRRTLRIRRDTSPWLAVDRAHAVGLSPYDFRALGPLLALRAYLSEMQWDSLNQPPDSAEPVLARFEIVEAVSLSFGPLRDSSGALSTMAQDGFRLRVILYWVTLDREGGYPRGACRIIRPMPFPPGAVEASPELQAIERRMRASVEEMVRRHEASGDTRRGTFGATDQFAGLRYTWRGGFRRTDFAGQWGPRPRELTIETVEYVLKPDGITEPREVEGNYGPLKEVVQGTSGWVLDETRTRQVSSETITIGDWNHVVPLYDISVQKFPNSPPAPREDPLLPPWSNTHCHW